MDLPTRGPLTVTCVSRAGTALVVEELVAVVAVTSSLLNSLHHTIARFPYVQARLSPRYSFINPLCRDVVLAFSLLDGGVREARRLKIFEPNDVGLVRLPRAAWEFVLGTEQKVASLRSRLFVEKYRVRVLIDAVAWEGLRCMAANWGWLGERGEDAKECMEELASLSRMLPLIAERSVGVHKDYKPRLLSMRGLAEKVVVGVMPPFSVVVPTAIPPPVPTSVLNAAPILAAQAFHPEPQQIISDEKLGCHSSASSTALACSVAAIDDSIHETWILRRNRPRKEFQSRTSVLGLPLLSTHAYSAATYDVLPRKSAAERVLRMDEGSPWEIQRLLKARERASSGETVRRRWEVVGLRGERTNGLRISAFSCPSLTSSVASASPSLSASTKRKRWLRICGGGGGGGDGSGRGKRIVEWQLVLRGETVDREERVLPSKHVDPWASSPQPGPKKNFLAPVSMPMSMPMPGQVRGQMQGHPRQAAAAAAAVLQYAATLMHVENRRVFSFMEAEIKMREIVEDLFDPGPGPGPRADDETVGESEGEEEKW
ncbi:hypothetical protein MBM_04832 [Drepanopeziza brunnea f. sp. 'multigermtubi' MB_m1]|uniref:Uncharacterized protein n=1 Tax=Marssonina brunnea f. sp. multigermtubi (strain MB_m1) TaxID=1072389 RepID=K1WI36_MARBU|nr:uncharacterized protein MBM_04832 [Drepanopeziza brunnea f. sp. 'multigermtubi' MB_m1]EKD17255.1 hypothetical protein MBM_04832 [Drepanopeziza brunnea f. sp. 'multigermtubi' MB_m1]